MIISITAKGNSTDASVEERFGRSPYVVLFDSESDTSTVVENPNAGAAGGAGPRTVQLLVNHDVKVLITGRVGSNAESALKVAGIETYQVQDAGTVKDALVLYREGKLRRIL